MAVKGHITDEDAPLATPEQEVSSEGMAKVGSRISEQTIKDATQERTHPTPHEYAPKQEEKPQEESEVQNPEEETQGEGETPNPEDKPSEDEVAKYDEENLDPDKEVDVLLAEEHIDREGDEQVLEDQLVSEFEEVKVIHSEDGEAQMAAISYDGEGNQIMLVDVDGDQMFDNLQIDDVALDISSMGVNVGDVELAMGGDQYLANNGENTENFDGEDYTADMIG